MRKKRMTETVIVLYLAYQTDHGGNRPTALRMHPEDWDRLRYEVDAASGYLAPGGKRFMGMVPLIDPRWKKGFPICIGPSGAAEAHEAGARSA